MTKKEPLKIHITGVYGLIGNLIYSHLNSQPELFDVYGSGRRTVSSARADGDTILPLPDDHFVIADLSDAQAIQAAIAGMDAVLHIGAVPDPGASFDIVLQSNIIGTYNVLEACRIVGVRRLVYASSIMVSFGYFTHSEPYKAIKDCRWDDIPANIPMITHRDLPRPTEPYSVSKVYGEAICRTYFDRCEISTVCLRIGYVNKEDFCETPYLNSVWFSHRDCVNLIDLALVATERPLFEICYGVSDNQNRWVDIDHSHKVLGYVPRDSHERRYADRNQERES